jgi:EAL domain-containing protein (putative c-di-GMP-specific phosphodiesterase class I)
MASVIAYDVPLPREAALPFEGPAARRPAKASEADARALREALDRDEVVAWFQPVHRTSDGALIGAEAFARWARPGQTALSHHLLMPIAERAGLSTRITGRVVAQALAFRRSLAAPAGFSLSVNLSPADLRDAAVVDRLHAVTDSFGGAPCDLVLEVAEGRLVEAPRVALDRLAALRHRGFGLTVDEFGSGGSSCGLLAQVPFAMLKVDARFMLAAPTDRVAEGIVEACAHLGRRLGMTLAAEGVETPAHRALCRQLGIAAAQGTAPGAALAAADFVARYLAA